MTKREFLLHLDELLELEAGTIKGDELLASWPKWDSLAIIAFIALIDQHFGASVPAIKIMNCRTPNDLAMLVAERLQN